MEARRRPNPDPRDPAAGLKADPAAAGAGLFREVMAMASHMRRRYPASTTVGPVLLALLVVGSWLAGRGPAAWAQPPAGAGQPPPAQRDYSYFEKLKKQADEERKKAEEHYLKTRAAAQPHIEAKVQARGGTDEAREQLGLTLNEINARLAPNAPPAPPGTPASRVEPGMRLEVLMKNGNLHYSGTLVGIEGSKVLLQTIHIAGAKPSSFELADIAAFHTKFGIFAYNPKTGRIVPALTYFAFNQKSGNFERMTAGTGDAFLAEVAKVVGPSNSALALYGVAPDGSWSIGLPVPYTESPAAIPAFKLATIITPLGVYTYDAKLKNYTYETHVHTAQMAQAARDAAREAYYQRRWDRDVQWYQLENDRIRAMRPYYNSYWGSGSGWLW
jgi:hypothetical protein